MHIPNFLRLAFLLLLVALSGQIHGASNSDSTDLGKSFVGVPKGIQAKCPDGTESDLCYAPPRIPEPLPAPAEKPMPSSSTTNNPSGATDFYETVSAISSGSPYERDFVCTISAISGSGSYSPRPHEYGPCMVTIFKDISGCGSGSLPLCATSVSVTFSVLRVQDGSSTTVTKRVNW